MRPKKLSDLVPSEESIQIMICSYLDLVYPDILYTATCGGLRTSIKQANKAKKTGYRKGLPDMIFFEPRKGFHGMCLEVKRDKRSYPSKAQETFIDALNGRDYLAKCVKGFEEAKEALDWYFGK